MESSSPVLKWRMDVTDETEAVRFRLRFSAEVDPQK
jgi:hypothetical protein